MPSFKVSKSWSKNISILYDTKLDDFKLMICVINNEKDILVFYFIIDYFQTYFFNKIDLQVHCKTNGGRI